MALKESVRLQKYLAQCGIASRRKAEQYIAEGRVKVNGNVVRLAGTTVVAGVDRVQFDNKVVAPETTLFYFLLNKPKGYITSVSDPQGRPVVTDLIDECEARLFPVGRLDFDTEGALILTNDGELAQKIQHPSHEVHKTYEAVVYGHPGKARLQQLEKGIMLDGKKTAPARVKLIKKMSSTSLCRITIHEGKKHQVKKMFQAIGHPVTSLKRTAYGKLFLNKLALGKARKLGPADIKKIFL